MSAAATQPSGIYARLGVRTFINAVGTLTTLSGSLMPPEVRHAMDEASRNFVTIHELQDKVGKTESYGSFTAPSTGIHGWFWENKGNKTVNVVLHTAGFYDSIKYFGASGEEELPVAEVE